MSDDDVRVISGLCRRLDGLPLAIHISRLRKPLQRADPGVACLLACSRMM